MAKHFGKFVALMSSVVVVSIFMPPRLAAGIAAVMIVLWVGVELAYGGGNPNHKDHDRLRDGWHLW